MDGFFCNRPGDDDILRQLGKPKGAVMKIASFAVLGFACLLGSPVLAKDAGTPVVPAAASGDAAAPAKTIDWDKMSKAEKKKYMKSTVLPEMKKVFVAFDAKKFAKVTCATCHGDGATDGKFKMPNPKLPKLPQPTNRDGFMALNAKKPEMVKFMGTQVKPNIARLLGKPEWSPTNPTGYGCYGCHTKEGE
jgi:hypothetical protein